MAKFRKKELVISARRATEDGVVETSRGPRDVMQGEWILTGDESVWVLSDLIFRSLYDPVDDEARELLKEP